MNTEHRKKTVMIVDDSPLHVRELREMIGDAFDVSSATSAGEALKMLHKRMPDLLLLDILMPEMDGRHMLRYIRDLERTMKVAPQNRAKIVMMSALGFPQGGVKELHSQCNAYMTKPITKEKLADVLKAQGFSNDH